jgi:uncharacterized Ntn-hydrolase superfamily protein
MKRLALLLAVLLPAGVAHATYSIVATDRGTQQVGGAGASCVGAVSVRVIYGAVPGVGAVHAQAELGGAGKGEAVARLGLGMSPVDIIAAITDVDFDPQAARRQYGVVDLRGRAAGFTGAEDGPVAGDRQDAVDGFTFAVQGNLLSGDLVLDHAARGFEGCDLADRLVRALEAGARGGEGDRRCTVRGLPADSAFVEVDRAGEPAGTYLRLEVTDTAPTSAVARLRTAYDAWRSTHPCPPRSVDAGLDPALDDGGCCDGRAGASATPLAVVLVAISLARSRRRWSVDRGRDRKVR